MLLATVEKEMGHVVGDPSGAESEGDHGMTISVSVHGFSKAMLQDAWTQDQDEEYEAFARRKLEGLDAEWTGVAEFFIKYHSILN